MWRITCCFHNYSRKFVSLLKELGFPCSICAKLYDFHYKCINHELDRLFQLSCIKTRLIDKNFFGRNYLNKRIWVFWWQGKNKMPVLVKRCINSIFIHSNGHKVVLITKYNIKDYAKLPEYIYRKVDDGCITLTHFSDILRFNLLKNYGGLWMDSTIYCIKDVPNLCFNKKLYTVNVGYDVYHSNISLGRWTGFFMGGHSKNPLFIFMDTFFKLYWKHNNYLIDYFLVDYALNFAYKNNIGNFYKYDSNLNSNPYICRMTEIGNKKCNDLDFNRLLNETLFFKLSYKNKIKRLKNTYYSRLFCSRK